jgi:hypothetical protein
VVAPPAPTPAPAPVAVAACHVGTPPVATQASFVSPQPVLNFNLPAVNPSVQRAQQRMGANVGPANYYTRSQTYVDLMQHAQGFGVTGQPWKDPATLTPPRGPIALGADGWPTEDFGVVLMGDQASLPDTGGRYTVAFKGTAVVATIASTGATLGTPCKDGEYTVIDLDFKNGTNQLILNFAGTNGTVKDLMVIRPGYDWKQYRDKLIPSYTKAYMASLSPYSTLRYMDFMFTNSLYDVTWANRPTIENTRAGMTPAGGSPGKPWERVIELANATNTDAWINVPVKADATYYVELAKLFKAKLNPNLRVYVEYGNEMWNASFQQFSWLLSIKRDANGNRIPGAIDEEIALGNDARVFAGLSLAKSANGNYVDYYNLGTRVYADRVIRISEAFRSVYQSDFNTRVRPVLAWQGSGSFYVEQMLNYIKSAYPAHEPSYYLYGTAYAPYFNMADAKGDMTLQRSATSTYTVSSVLAALGLQVDLAYLNSRFEHNAYLTKKNGLKMLAYEGGPDTYGDGSLAAKAGASRDIGMYTLCQKHLNNWADYGGDLFMWFGSGAGTWDTKYGTWSVMEFIDPTMATSPKQACMIWASMTPSPVARGRHVPGVAFDATEQPGIYYPTTDTRYNTARRWYKLGQTAEYMVSSPTATCYNVSVSGRDTKSGDDFAANPAGQFEVSINGVVQGASNPIATTTGTAPVWSPMGQACLPAGLSIMGLKMTQVAGGLLDKILLSPIN